MNNFSLIEIFIFFVILSFTSGNSIDVNKTESIEEEIFVNETETVIIETKIVGGVEANPNEFPWLIRIQSKSGSLLCGGAIIEDDLILTAAHCLDGASKSKYEIVAGAHDVDRSESNRQVRNIKAIHVHEHYNSVDFQNDICTVKLSSKLNFNSVVAKIPLSNTTLTLPNTGMVAGWGALSDAANSSPVKVLRKVEVPMIDHSLCASQYVGYNRITDKMICAGVGGKDSCQGDSGGPLMCQINGTFVACGIVSFGVGCAKIGFPGVYTKVSSYLKWIDENDGLRISHNPVLTVLPLMTLALKFYY